MYPFGSQRRRGRTQPSGFPVYTGPPIVSHALYILSVHTSDAKSKPAGGSVPSRDRRSPDKGVVCDIIVDDVGVEIPSEHIFFCQHTIRPHSINFQ